MSDFFDHLLNPGQDQAGGLAPLPVSINEPVQAAAGLEWDALELESDGSAVPSSLAPPSSARPSEAAQPPLAMNLLMDDDLRRRMEQFQSWLNSMASYPAPPHQGQPPEPPFSAPTADDPVSPLQIQPRPAPAKPALPPQAPPREENLLQNGLPPQPGPVMREVLVHPPASAILRPRRVEEAVPPAQPKAGAVPSAPAEPAALHPEPLRETVQTARLSPRPLDQSPLPGIAGLPGRQVSQLPPRPVVHVTIGRIEVRAARPPAAAQPLPAERRGAPSPMSLDEYLRRRTEGGRR